MNWESWVNGAKTVGSWLGTGLKWTAYKVGLGGALYVKNTGVQLLKQGLALDDAVPALVNKPHSRKILDSMVHIAVYDVAPIVALNYLNNAIQIYSRSGSESEVEASWYSAYSVFLSVLTLADYAVKAYTWRQSAQTFIRVTTLDALGPIAFNHDSARDRVTFCQDEKCSLKRRLKGSLREPGLLLANDALAELVKYIPYVGGGGSQFIRLISNGRYITRSAIPEVCERHKSNFMVTEHILSLGLTYTMSLALMNYALSSIEPFVGMPPYMYYRTLQHLLLLLHTNIAAHMTSPKVRPENTHFPLDPLVVYEWTSRFIYDVIFSGLLKRIPVDFKFDPNSKALIPLSTALQYATWALKSDLEVEVNVDLEEKEKRPYYGFFGQNVKKIKGVVLPPILRGTDELINDPIMLQHWPQMRIRVLSTVAKFKKASQSRVIATANIAPESAVKVLYLMFGMPKKITRILLELSRDQDFLSFLDALQDWFERHKIKTEVVMAPVPAIVLHGDSPIVLPPVDLPKAEPVSPEQLQLVETPKEKVKTDLQELLPDRARDTTKCVVGADNFFPVLTRRKTAVRENKASNSTVSIANLSLNSQ